ARTSDKRRFRAHGHPLSADGWCYRRQHASGAGRQNSRPTPRNSLMLLIKNGRVIDPASKTDAAIDILIDGETIAEIAPALEITRANNAEVFDAAGLIVAPGFIDMHVHLREPGQENSETIETGTLSAARGGF